jgi:hypothetical protein
MISLRIQKLSILTAFILLVVLQAAAQAQNAADNKDKTSKSASGDRGYFEICASRGLTYPFGDISGDGGQKAHIADSKSAGINTGYEIINSHIIYMGIAMLTQTFEVERKYMNKLMLTSVEAEFINLDLAYRYQGEWYYAGAGLFMGIPGSTWSRKNALNGIVTENLLYGDMKSACKITTGLELFAGLTFAVNNTISLNNGMIIMIPFIPDYKHGQDSIYVMDISICASVAYKFNVPFIN